MATLPSPTPGNFKPALLIKAEGHWHVSFHLDVKAAEAAANAFKRREAGWIVEDPNDIDLAEVDQDDGLALIGVLLPSLAPPTGRLEVIHEMIETELRRRMLQIHPDPMFSEPGTAAPGAAGAEEVIDETHVHSEAASAVPAEPAAAPVPDAPGDAPPRVRKGRIRVGAVKLKDKPADAAAANHQRAQPEPVADPVTVHAHIDALVPTAPTTLVAQQSATGHATARVVALADDAHEGGTCPHCGKGIHVTVVRRVLITAGTGKEAEMTRKVMTEHVAARAAAAPKGRKTAAKRVAVLRKAKVKAKAKAKVASKANGAHAPAADSKQAKMIEMLRTARGATIAELSKRFGWSEGTVRSQISGVLKGKLGLEVVSAVSGVRGRVYCIAA